MNPRTSRRSAVRLLTYPAVRRFVPAVRDAPPVDGSLALALSHAPSTGPPPGPPRPRSGTPPGPRPALRSVRPADDTAEPDLATAAEVILRLAFEAFAGRRPFNQLARWVTLKVAQELSQYPAAAPRRASPPRILASWIQTPAPGHAEVGAVAQVGGHIQAIALRLERFRGRWRCRALETTIPPAAPALPRR
jgi:hypothetical protein